MAPGGSRTALVWLNQHQFLLVDATWRHAAADHASQSHWRRHAVQPTDHAVRHAPGWLLGTAVGNGALRHSDRAAPRPARSCGRKERDPAQSLTPEQRKRYALSNDTWTRATAELVELGLVRVGRASGGPDLEWRRSRNTYTVLKERLQEPPGILPKDAPNGRPGVPAPGRR